MGVKRVRVTGLDVARAAGVSKNTVSLVVKNSPLVAETTRKHVQKVIDELNYQPHAVAAALRMARSHTLGFLLPQINQSPLSSSETIDTDVFLNRLLLAVTLRAQEAKHYVLLNTLLDSAEIVGLFTSGRIDGVLVDWRFSNAVVTDLLDHGVPAVLVGRDASDLPVSWVKASEEAGAYEATRHLIELGHIHFGLLKADEDDVIVRERVHGYTRALDEAGVAIKTKYIARGDWTLESGRILGQQLLALQPRPTALFALNELMAVGLLQAAQIAGLRVPADLAIVTVEDSPVVKYVQPQLTAVHVPMYEVGTRAAEVLLALLEHPESEPQQITLPTTFVVRQSSVLESDAGKIHASIDEEKYEQQTAL